MITTPIADFIRRYAERKPLRLHMPGHKGYAPDGSQAALYAHDLTEIEGADSLYHANGIIAESERNAGALFGADTFYSAEGSSLAIRTMLALALRFGRRGDGTPLLLAGRNAHRVLMSAAALLDFQISFLTGESYLSCPITPERLETAISALPRLPFAVYLTSPDYLGNLIDLRGCAEVCHRHGILLLVDNAHGAYLKFLPTSLHPMDAGVDLCADSAHKTLPVLTGGAYLHLNRRLPSAYREAAKETMLLFASTSPSYLILESLDIINRRLANDFRSTLASAIAVLGKAREQAARLLPVLGDEPLKWTLSPKPYGYTGTELAARLAAADVVCEFADPDVTVLMFSPDEPEAAEAVLRVLSQLPRRAPITAAPPSPSPTETVLSIREALLAPSEEVEVAVAVGRVLADASISCPPAVPIVISGERISREAARALTYYGISSCRVVKAR